MENNNKKKIEPWRIIVFVIAVAFIIFMWVKKDIAEIYATMPSEQIFPLVATTIAVSLLKVAAIAGAILLNQMDSRKNKKTSEQIPICRADSNRQLLVNADSP